MEFQNGARRRCNPIEKRRRNGTRTFISEQAHSARRYSTDLTEAQSGINDAKDARISIPISIHVYRFSMLVNFGIRVHLRGVTMVTPYTKTRLSFPVAQNRAIYEVLDASPRYTTRSRICCFFVPLR